MGETMIAAFTTGFTSVSTDVMSIIGAIIPIALGIMGVVWISKKASKWFKAMT